MTPSKAIEDAVFAMEIEAPSGAEHRFGTADKIIAALDAAGFDIVAKADLRSLLKELEEGTRLAREMNDLLGVPPDILDS